MDRTPPHCGIAPWDEERGDLEMTLISAGVAEQLVAGRMELWKMETGQKRLKG